MSEGESVKVAVRVRPYNQVQFKECLRGTASARSRVIVCDSLRCSATLLMMSCSDGRGRPCRLSSSVVRS